MRPAAIRPKDLQNLHARAVEAGLARAEIRPLLLAGLSPALVARIRSASAPADQLRLDLETLAREPAEGGVDPIAVWLQNAVHQVGDRVVAEVFEGLLRARRRPPRTTPMGILPPNPARIERSASEHLAKTPHAERLEQCLFGLGWPLRVRTWRPSRDTSAQLAVVSVLARHRGMRALLEPMGDGCVGVSLARVADGHGSMGSSGPFLLRVFESPTAVRQAIEAYFEGSSEI